MNRINLLVTIPQPLRDKTLSAATRSAIDQIALPTYNEDGHNWSAEELAERLPGQDAVLASWGLARLSEQVLAGADCLKIVAYGAGSVKGWATDALYDRGVVVSHAASRIADSVADYTLLLAMMGLRRPQDFSRRMKAGEAWPKPERPEQYEIAGKKVGLLGFGYVGRRTTALFKAVGAHVHAYDPYVTAEAMAAAGAIKAELAEIMSACQIVSVHLPVTAETRLMIGARELALLADGAVFINTARSWVVDQDALLAELRTGRIWAALDVFDHEPLAADHPYRELDNVLLSPHVAGMTQDSYYGLTENMMAEIQRFFRGEPLHYQVTREALARMA